MNEKVEMNFCGFVKAVIGATGLFAMGAVVAGSAMGKGFREGAKSVIDSINYQDCEIDKNIKNTETTEASDKKEENSS